MYKILMIDDDKSFLNIYSRIIASNGYYVQAKTNIREAMELLDKENFNIVILDVVMPEMNGVDLLKKIKEKNSEQLVMMLTGEGSIAGAVESMENGAYTYMIKPFEIDQLILNIKKAEEFLKLNDENVKLRTQLNDMTRNMEVVGSSEAMNSLKDQISQIAPTNSSVLITGESGTGKEIVANLLHYNSERRDGPLIKVNCSALAKNILESELFGHEKGAFTGAIATKKGRFEMATGGTLFLDEIGDMPYPLQSKLLRVLQEKEIERVGGTKTIKVDFRLICATNKDLRKEIEKGHFREDLYFRINVVPLVTTPLRERKDDIIPLMEYYLDYYANEMSKSRVKITGQAKRVLLSYSWRGNVRELKNMAERLIVFSSGADIQEAMLPKEIRQPIRTDEEENGSLKNTNLRMAREQFEKQFITETLIKNNGNITATAKELEIARKNLQAKMKHLEIDRTAVKQETEQI
ncbi:sigma-54-dependent transcriptional regulator [Aminipila luticellarii]|uniref:Stage 0 sporulation protein A homolog n=1 Tax=Aminipila luticellarii TaxID=2507160 RepID=A0A410PWY1_9FIRM|nr:sigma-54 dependent transcriptional regulator [Aminipila luticellarii]QAT43376.1 sigma-54-dependent Fis family transcriptional regulator [Aminipila luticellarii]